jgi:predicted metal-dependent hydrolase
VLTTPSFDLDGRAVPYAVRRSTRAKWIRSELVPGEGLRVVLPAADDPSRVEPFLRRHRRWLARGLRRLERLSAWPRPRLRQGTTVPWLDETLTLDLRPGPAAVVRDGSTLAVRVPRRTPAAVRRALQAWYEAEGLRELAGRVRALAARHGLAPKDVVVRDFRRVWGRCTPRGGIGFSWRVLLTPGFVADYLVAHELAHLDVRGHGPRFRARVAALCPGWESAERWLRRLGPAVAL